MENGTLTGVLNIQCICHKKVVTMIDTKLVTLGSTKRLSPSLSNLFLAVALYLYYCLLCKTILNHEKYLSVNYIMHNLY